MLFELAIDYDVEHIEGDTKKGLFTISLTLQAFTQRAGYAV